MSNHALVCMSRSPLLDHKHPAPETEAAVAAAFDTAREFVREFDPELIVSFGPDHYNGFFYDLMPPFCIGFAASGAGDYDSFDGELDVPSEVSAELAEFVIDRDIDVAISRKMVVDHGAVQPLEILHNGDAAARPTIPVFVNSVARPLVKMSRIRKFGQAIGEYFANSDRRVLFLGSGGLSHDPPVPQIATANDAQRHFCSTVDIPRRKHARRARRTPSPPPNDWSPARPTSWI
jgi:2,3-dihydroxyphenylpropionate 1,2-dioxygenase